MKALWKIMVIIMVMLTVVSVVWAAAITVSFTMTDAQLARISDAMKNLYAIPQVPIDPAQPQLGFKNQFTDNQWVKECIRRWIIDNVQKWEQQKANAAAVVTVDNSIIQ